MNMSEIVDTVTACKGVHSILLFGSFIKGKATEDSDIDLCIIEEPGSTLTVKEKLRIMRDLPEKIDIPFFHERKDFCEFIAVINEFIKENKKE